jgi:amidase
MDTYHRWMQVVIPASLIGLPVVNIPAGFGDNGLPAGLQLIGPRASDGQLLRLAQEWHLATGWPDRKPPVLD